MNKVSFVNGMKRRLDLQSRLREMGLCQLCAGNPAVLVHYGEKVICCDCLKVEMKTK